MRLTSLLLIWGKLMQKSNELHRNAEFVWHIATTAPVKASTHAVLNAILLTKKFDSPHVQMYFSTLGRVCGGKDRKDVKVAVKILENLGILVVQGEKVHGRGLANTYEIVDITGVIPTWDELKRGDVTPVNRIRDTKTTKRGENQLKTGGKSTKNGGTLPPQTYNHINNKNADAPSRGETNQGNAGKLTPEQQELMVLLRTNSYSEARRIMDDRKRA